MRIRRYLLPLFLVFCGASVLLIANQAGAEDKRIDNIVALSDTYTYTNYPNDPGLDRVEVRNPLFSKPAYYTANGAVTPGGNQVEVRCGSYSLYSTLHISNDTMSKLRSGWKGELTYELTISNADLIGGNCPELVELLKSQKKSQTPDAVTKQVDEKAKTAAAKAMGAKLESRNIGLFKDLKAEFVKKDRPGCATIGGSRNCDEAWRESLGRCVATAKEKAASQYTSPDAAGVAQSTAYLREFFSECLSDIVYGNNSKKEAILEALTQAKIDLREELSAGDKALNESLSGQLEETQNRVNEEKKTQKEEEKKTCGSEVTTVGWMMCPLLNVASEFGDGVWKLFEGLLRTNPLKGQSGDYLYELWTGFRDIANALLVIVFLVIVISQLSGSGISNQGIKRMLPRIIIMTVVVNISFFLLQIAVDVANILGTTMYDFIINAGNFSTKANLDNVGFTGLISDILTTGGLTFAAGTGIAVAGAAVGMPAALIFMALLVIPAVLGFVGGVLALIIRSALIPVMAVVAPVALAAYILPNTQGLFDKWKKTALAMISLYPLASIYYGGLKLAALVAISTGGTGGRLIGLVILFGGAFVVLILAIKANAITGRIIGGVVGAARKLMAPVEGLAKETLGQSMKEGFHEFKAGSSRFRRSPIALARGITKGFDRRRRDRQTRLGIHEANANTAYVEGLMQDYQAGGSRLRGLEATVAGKDLIREAESRVVGQRMRTYRGQNLQQLGGSLSTAMEQGNHIDAQAIQNLMVTQGGRGLEAFSNRVLQAESAGHMTGQMRSALTENFATNHSGLMMKDFALREWAQTSNSLTNAQKAWTGYNDNTKNVNAKDFSNMSAAAQMRLLGATETKGPNGEIKVTVAAGGGNNLDANAIRALLNSATELGESIPRGGPVDKALNIIAKRENIDLSQSVNITSSTPTAPSDNHGGSTGNTPPPGAP